MATSLPPMNGRCPTYRCGEIMDVTTDGNGRVVMACRLCERAKAGLCIDCPRPLTWRAHCGYGSQRRCPTCQARATKRREKHRAQRPWRKAQVLAFVRRYRSTPEGRQATRAACRKYHAGHPYTDLDRKIRRIRARQRRERRQKVAA